ncbi:MAG: potassium-transporting ATPase subunit KdpB [Anaerolineales bacterium]
MLPLSSKPMPLFETRLLRRAIVDSFSKLDPRTQLKNPVMFVVMVGAALSTVTVVRQLLAGVVSGFDIQIVLWLWFTVLFANFAEAMAEGRGKAQADSLRKMRTTTMAKKLDEGLKTKDESWLAFVNRPSSFVVVATADLKRGDRVVVEAGEIIPGDGEVVEGIASVDESAITGESAPVIRESGGDRSAVTGGTRVLSDRIIVRITSEPGGTFLDRMIAMVEGAKRQKTPNEIALTILLAAFTIIFLLAVISLKPFATFSETAAGQIEPSTVTVPVLVALLVCLIPTTIGGLLSAIGISGMDRLIRRNVLATSGRAVEAAGDIDVLLLDKTGTITLGNRMASAFLPASGITSERLGDAAQLASLADETPEGRSIVVLAKERFGLRGREVAEPHAAFIPFTAQTRMSGVDFPAVNGVAARLIRKGAAEAVKAHVDKLGGVFPNSVQQAVDDIARQGGTPLVVTEGADVLGVVQLKDVVKGGIRDRFARLRAMGIRTVMITGDNPLTAAAIAAEAGVDDFMAQATPEAKLKRIREEQTAGHLVAMTGDGTNDAPALAQSDVGVAMNTGTQAAREAGNMVDLDSNPTKLIEIVEIGKQLLMTRGALTTFSIANDVAKYFAIIPALFGALYALPGMPGPLAALNIMRLASPQSAILSAVIFNALIIIALIPLALRGVSYQPMGAGAILQRNLLIYGVGGIIVPFIGIKLIDVLLVALRLV